MTTFELVEDVAEKTGLPSLEVLRIVQQNWPTLSSFTPTQRNLLVDAILFRRQRATDTLKRKFGVS